jgi:ABC-type transporter Mla MlaB component
MLKISTKHSGTHGVTLRLEGRIAEPWTSELGKTCEQLLRERKSIRLDMAEVSFADRTGLELLRCLQSRGVALVECSPFTAEQMKGIQD